MKLQAIKITWFHGSRVNQYVFAYIITVPILSFGMGQGWLSPMMSVLQSPNGPSETPFTSSDISWMTSVVYVIAIIVGAPMGYLTDKYGRKLMTLVTTFSLMVHWLIKLFCMEPWAVILSQAVAGIPCSACYIVLPIYLKEISDIDLRGALGSLLIMNRNLGLLISYVAADLLPINPMLWFGLLVPTILFFILLALPETPEYLVKQGKQDEAKEVLAWLRGVPSTDSSVQSDIETFVRDEKQVKTDDKSAWSVILHDRPTFKAFVISLVIKITQQFDGFLVILIYSGYIFEKASETISLKLSPNKQVMVIGAAHLVGSLVATALVEKTGRKPLLVTTSFIVGLGMFLLSTWFYLTSVGLWLPGWLPLLAVCLCIFADAAGFHPISYIVITDMFRFQLCGTVTSFATTSVNIANFIQIKWFTTASEALGIHWTFVFFAFISFTSGLFALVFYPETRQKTVDQIYAKLARKKKNCDIKSGGVQKTRRVRVNLPHTYDGAVLH